MGTREPKQQKNAGPDLPEGPDVVLHDPPEREASDSDHSTPAGEIDPDSRSDTRTPPKVQARTRVRKKDDPAAGKVRGDGGGTPPDSGPPDGDKNHAERFLELFKSNTRSTGKFNPATGKMQTDHESVSIANVNQHIKGVYGIGLVPILDNGTCHWAAIDIDNHGDEHDIPIGPIDKMIVSKGLPLVPCRSKSGGVHVYAFFDGAWSATRVRALMTSYAVLLKVPKAEIFPKQAVLRSNNPNARGEDLQYGNWINLPYLGGDKTVRYAYRDGRRLTLEQFLTLAEHTTTTRAAIYDNVDREHPQAPPCVQRMLSEGVGEGQRNEGLYTITVYLRKAFPQDYSDRARELNRHIFAKPLGKQELERTVASAGRPEYRYRCNEEPQRSLCDRDICLTRGCGITPGDAEARALLEDLPTFSELTKYVADPVRWEVKVDEKTMTNIPTEILMDWRKLRLLIAEHLTKVVPMLKPQEWERMLQELMGKARIMVTPDDASPSGVVRERLREFAQKARNLGVNENVQDRQALLRGLPIVAVIDEVQQIAFRAQDFLSYLKRNKTDDLRGVNIWFAVKSIGVRQHRIKVAKGKAINVWMLPYTEIQDIMEETLEVPSFKAEL